MTELTTAVPPSRSLPADPSAAVAADGTAALRDWLEARWRRSPMRVEQVPLASLAGWRSDPDSGVVGHATGRFFTVEGLAVRAPGAPVPAWHQPVVHQPEVGILGLLARDDDGVRRFLVQAKAEPGNRNGLQLSPTVQATRSNYTRVHGGRSVPFLEYFQDPARRRLVDVRQSEHGSWFYRKRNRNMVVLTTDDIAPPDGFRWLTSGQLHRLLAVDDLVNMDTRTVLSCLPRRDRAAATPDPDDDGFRACLARSCTPGTGGLHHTGDILMWLTDVRSRTELRVHRTGLVGLPGWRRTDEAIAHESGLFFEVIGVDVRAEGREVPRWAQPMVRPRGDGLVAFLVGRIRGVLHVLVHARMEPGLVDVVELAPTVQCTPANLACLPPRARPPFLDDVLAAPADRIRFSAVLSEEGGRLYQARSRYLVVEIDPDGAETADHRWLTLDQLSVLLRHSHYVNVQARSLVACLRSLLEAD